MRGVLRFGKVYEQNREKNATGLGFYPKYSVIWKHILAFFSHWVIFSHFSHVFRVFFLVVFFMPTWYQKREEKREEKKRH